MRKWEFLCAVVFAGPSGKRDDLAFDPFEAHERCLRQALAAEEKKPDRGSINIVRVCGVPNPVDFDVG